MSAVSPARSAGRQVRRSAWIARPANTPKACTSKGAYWTVTDSLLTPRTQIDMTWAGGDTPLWPATQVLWQIILFIDMASINLAIDINERTGCRHGTTLAQTLPTLLSAPRPGGEDGPAGPTTLLPNESICSSLLGPPATAAVALQPVHSSP